MHGGTLRSPEGVRRATEAQAAYYARWRRQMGLPSWWRFKLVGVPADVWLARQQAKRSEEP